jgi:branched-chain amino acid transport system substrate-binding protein
MSARMPAVWRGVTALAIAALLTGLAGPVAASSVSNHDEPIRIGINIEQSGHASLLGEAHVKALELRARLINEQGGILDHQVELVFRDNKSDPTESVTQTMALLEEDVVAIIGPGTTQATLAALPTVLESGIPTISMGSADEIVEPVDEHPNVFKTTPSGRLMARGLVEDMKRQGITRVGLIAVNNQYGDDGVGAWEELAEAGEVELLAVERFESTDVSMTSQLGNLVEAEPQAIVVWGIAPGAPTVRRNAVEELGVTLPMYFDTGAAEGFLELAGDAASGARIVHPKSMVWDQIPAEDPQYQALQEFGTAYTAEYGEISAFAGFAWDALGLVQAAIEQAGSTEPEAVNQALVDLGAFNGVSGVIDYTPEDHQGVPQEALVVAEIVDGRFALSG